VIRVAFLMFVFSLLPGLCNAQGNQAALDEPLAASVFSTALAFIAPRTLEAQSVPQLTLWGLRGLTALDPALVPELRENVVRLMSGSQLVFSAALPAEASPENWGLIAAQMASAAAGVSPAVAKAGAEGVIRSFFDELFNHLDPYSRYTPPSAAEKERDHRSGEAGLGLTLVRTGAAFVVSAVVPGSPADDEHIRPGDRVVSVDGRALRSETAAEANALIAGPDDTSVRLSWRGRDGRVHNTALDRTIVPPVTVSAERDGRRVQRPQGPRRDR
jgi:carboxyl-terminal processing protease